MWATGQLQIARNEVVADPIPGAVSGSARWGISVIARFEADFASRLLALGEELRPLCGENHTLYDASTLHTTIRACEFYRAGVTGDDASVETYQRVLGQLCREFGPFRVDYAGLNGNHTGIIAQGYAAGELPSFRRKLRGQLAACGLHHGPEAAGVRRTTHASVMVFGGPLAQAGAVAGWLAQRRTLPLGPAQLSTLNLVKYRRTASSVELVVLDEVDLSG